MTVQPVYDLAAGRAARDTGAAAALLADSLLLSAWRAQARNTMLVLADSGVTFGADDLVAIVGMPPRGRERALGGLFLWASKSGVITPVGWQQSCRRASHARPQRTWTGLNVRLPDEATP